MKTNRSEKAQKYRVKDTTLSEFLKDLRSEMNYTTLKMATALNMAASSYNGYETGQTKYISPDVLESILKIPYEKLYKDTGKTYDDFILMKLEGQFRKYSKEYLSEQLWMIYLSLTHSYATTNEVMMKKLEDMYQTDVWKVIFGTLNSNPTLKKKFIYPNKNTIYIDELTDSQKQNGDIPIFRINYELTPEQISEKQDLAFDGHKIAIVDLFMLVFNKEIKSFQSEQDAFKSTCKILYSIDANPVYNRLGLINLPTNMRPPISKETIKLFSELKEFLDERKELQNTDIMKTFCSNIKHSDWQFINTIAVDFNFLNNLTSELASDLKGQISDLVKRFVEQHLGSKYL